MEVLNVADNEQELIALALADVLQTENNAIEYSTKYFPKRESLLVCFTHQQDKEKLRHVVKQLKVDDAIYQVKWTKMDVCPSGDQACPANLAEVLHVTDLDLVCEHFRVVLGNYPRYSFEEKQNRLILYLHSDEELSRILEDEKPDVEGHGPVHVMPVIDLPPSSDQDLFKRRQDQKYCLEVLGVTDEDIVVDYIVSLIKRRPDYQYLKESSRIMLNLESQGECDRLLFKSVHYIEDLDKDVTFRKLSLPPKGLKVSGIPTDASEKYLNIYFKKEEIGGGPIKKLQWDSASGVAIVFYCQDGVAERVFKNRRHEIRNSVLTLEMIEDRTVDARPKSIGVTVSGIPTAVSQNYLNVYFKKDVNGGGAIRKLDWDPATGVARIFFCEENVAKNVASKNHKIREKEVCVQLIEEEENTNKEDTAGVPECDAANRSTTSESPASPVPTVDSQGDINASPEHVAADRQVTSCLVVSSNCSSVDELKRHIANSWQLHDGEFELQFNPSECLAIVRVTTTAGKLDQVLANPPKNCEVLAKCGGETQNLLGDVHILIEQISAETSREAVWSWLMVVTRCAAHTIYYSDVLPDKSINAVALISFNEGQGLDMSFKSASYSEYSIDNRTLHIRPIRSPLKLMCVGVKKKGESVIKQNLQELLDRDSDNSGRVDDVVLLSDRAIVYLSSRKAFQKLLVQASCLGCSYILPYYEQLGYISESHVVDYNALVTKIKSDLSTSDIKRSVRPRLIVTVDGERPSEETLRRFFADRSASGGDKTAILLSNADGRYAVTFDDSDAADRVVQKYQDEGLKLSTSRLSVFIRGMRATPNSSENQVVVRNIGLASEDSIKFFLRALTGSGNLRLTFVRDPHDGTLCALARFPKVIDRYRLAYYCEAATLDSNHLDIEPFVLSTAVILHNVPSSADKQMVKYCFETDDVKDCVEQGNGTWIVYFKDPEYAENVLDSEILYDGKVKLSAERHSEYRVETNARVEGKRGLHQIRCDWASFQTVDFVKKSKQHDFDRLLKETNAACEFSEDGHLLIRLSGSFTADHARAVEAKFRTFMNNYGYEQIDVLPDLWNEVLSSKELSEIQRLEKSVLQVVVSDVDHGKRLCRIALTGDSNAVQSARQKVEQAIRFISDQMERRKQRTTHTETLNPRIAKLLVANHVIRKLLDQQKDLVIEMDESRGTCHLEGYPSDIQRFLEHVSGTVASIAQESFDVSVDLSKFLERETIVSHINAKLLQENLIPGTLWCLPCECVVEVYGLQAEQVRKAVQAIRAEIFESDIKLGETMESVISNEKWKDCTDAICGRRRGDVIIAEDVKAGLLHVICKACDSPAVLEEINNFTRRNLIKRSFFKVPRMVVQLASTIFSTEIRELERGQSRNHVTLSPHISEHGECGFSIEGNADGCINIQRIVTDFLYKQQKVIAKQHVVRQPGATRFFSSRPSALKTIGTKSKTYIEARDPNSVVESQREDNSSEFVLPGGVLVAVKKASIVDIECDAIVNPSNGELRHIGGLAATIAEQGGIELVKECEDYVRQNGNLPEGQACVTSPGKGKLRCKKVIHAVGPRWQGGNRSEVNKLFQAVQNSLFHAEQNQLASIALPPISSGIFHYPLDLCTKTIVDSVVSYCEQKKGSLTQVLLVDINDEGVMHFRRALNRQLGNDSGPDPKESRHGSNNRRTNKERTDAHSQLAGPERSGNGSQELTAAFGDVGVEILREDICSQQVDVIVSTIGQDLDLSKGFLSKSILKAAGNEMEQELKKFSVPMEKGGIAITDGYKLKCQKVYHVCCPEFVPSQGGKQIREIALKILKQVNEEQLSSIVMPAIGTGNLGHPPESVAGQLFHAVQSFVESTRNPVLTKVKFVLTDALYEVFQDRHRKFLSELKAKPSNASTGRQAAFLFEESATRAITEKPFVLPATDADSTDRKNVTVNGVSIVIVRGDITDEETKIIVNCTDNNLNLNSQVSRAICRKGGLRISDECKDRRSKEIIRNQGVFLQSAGELKCDYVLHVDAAKSPQEIVRVCLKHAEDNEAESISFPAIGTGNKASDASDVAPVLIESVLAFIKGGHSRYLKNIRFVVFDGLMVEKFQDALEELLSRKQQSFLSKMTSKLSKLTAFWRGDDASSPVSFDHLKGGAEIASLDDVDNLDDVDDPDTEIVLDICGSETNIETAIRLVEELCASELRSCVISEEPSVISQLPEHEVERYMKLGNLVGVAVDVQRPRKVITLRSMDDFALSKVNENIIRSLKSLQVAYLGKQASDLDEEHSQLVEEEYSKQVQWQYKTLTARKWCNYPKVLNKKLEDAFSKQRPNLMYGPPSNRFAVDLLRCVDSSEKKLDEEVTVRRRDPRKLWPDEWDSTDEKYHEVSLDVKCFEFQEVEKEFVSALGGTQTQVLQIIRVQNPPLYLQYVTQKERIKSTMISNNPIERRLWHGTSEAAVKVICQDGFNRSREGSSDPAFGEGVYFAKNSNKATQGSRCQPNASNEKFVILAMVLTGDYEIGSPKMRVTNKKPGGSLASYDTTVDNLGNPAIFVTYNDAQAYPAYVVKFK